MPIDRFVLILVIVIAAAGLTVATGVFIAGSALSPALWLAAIPAALIVYVLWRVLADRLNSHEDDHYDRIEK